MCLGPTGHGSMIVDKSIGTTPYELVFGRRVMMPTEFEHKTLRKSSQLDLNITKSKKERVHQLNQLDELRKEALFHTKVIQQ